MREPQTPETAHRWWDLPAALLLLAALLTATLRLSSTRWTDHLTLVQTLTFLGGAAGLALGQSAFSRRQAAGLALAYALFAVPWQLGLTMPAGIIWPERLVSMAGRLSHSTSQLAGQQPVNDPILFLFLMSCLFWTLSVHAGYSLTRHGQPWQATLPTGLALFIIHIHDRYWPYRTWYLATYIFFALLLLARLTFLQNYTVWRRTHTRLPPYLGLDLIRATLLATAVLVILAWTAPALAGSVPLAERAWGHVARPWSVARSRMSNAFASLRASVGLINDYYGDSLPLGRGNLLNDTLVLAIEAPTRPIAGVRYYWRARVYDYYDAGWDSTLEDTQSLTPQQSDLNFGEHVGRWLAEFRFTPWVPISTLYVVPQPQWISRPVRAELEISPDGTADLSAIHAAQYLRPGETYTIRSAVTAVTVAELRAAGADYPDWVTGRYLQLPPTITDRTRELAQQITVGLENPYDKTVAITEYLRNNLRYSDTVPNWPQDQEPIDWILFEHRQAFCNYYATAEIVLLRSLGIPARLAVGYAQGERDLESNLYFVRQRDAHAWPEVFFPGIGWVEFEPTLNQLPIQRPSGENPVNSDPDASDAAGAGSAADALSAREALLAGEREPLPEPGSGFIGGSSPLLPVLLAAASTGLILASLLLWRRRRAQDLQPFPILLESGLRRCGLRTPHFLRRWARIASLTPLERAYLEINKALGRIARPPHPHETPAERASSLASLLPALAVPARHLVREYQAAVYGPRAGDLQVAIQAARTIRNLSWLAWLHRLVAPWQEPEKRRAFFS